MTRPNQGLSSLALGGGERETLGTRLPRAAIRGADRKDRSSGDERGGEQ